LPDENFSQYVKLYAKDQEAWYRDFAAAFSKLLELGTADLRDS
jgi:cytochrome c peroxidase